MDATISLFLLVPAIVALAIVNIDDARDIASVAAMSNLIAFTSLGVKGIY